jgi:hypothetical protein
MTSFLKSFLVSPSHAAEAAEEEVRREKRLAEVRALLAEIATTAEPWGSASSAESRTVHEHELCCV